MSLPREAVRIAVSMTVTCAAGALVLAGVFVLTEHTRAEADRRRETAAITELLGLSPEAKLTEVRPLLSEARREVIYRAAPYGDASGAAREVAFTLDGRLVSAVPLSGPRPDARDLRPLGRMLVATDHGRPAGFLVEGEARGYKNRIRFLVALSPDYEIGGVRVIEHEEDPGLGAEIATGWFLGQFAGRAGETVARLDVTRDPMPEDWRGTLDALARRQPDAAGRHRALLERERSRPIYAVTGATISSRALTEGVRTTVEHFRRRWTLLAPHLGERS